MNTDSFGSDSDPEDIVAGMVAMFDGTASQQQASRLSQMLREDAEFRKTYTEYAATEAALLWLYRDVQSATADLSKISEPTSGRSFLGWPLPRPSGFLQHKFVAIAMSLAASIVAIVLWGFLAPEAGATAPMHLSAAIKTADQSARRYELSVARLIGQEIDPDKVTPKPIADVLVHADRLVVRLRGPRRLTFGGRKGEGIWVAPNPSLGVEIAESEMGERLCRIRDLAELRLQTFLDHLIVEHELTLVEDRSSASEMVIIKSICTKAEDPIRRARIELDPVNNQVQRLVMVRHHPSRGPTLVSFRLQEVVSPDESRWQLSDYLNDHATVLADSSPITERRRALEKQIFSRIDGWIKKPSP